MVYLLDNTILKIMAHLQVLDQENLIQGKDQIA